MTDSVPPRPGPTGGARPTVLLGDVTASSVTAWSVLGELGAPPPQTASGDSPQQWRTAPGSSPVPPPPVEPVRGRAPGQPGPRGPRAPTQTREQGQQREQRAQRDRQVVAQRARDEDTRQRQVRPGVPVGSRPPQRPAQRTPPGQTTLQGPGQRSVQGPGQRAGQGPGQRSVQGRPGRESSRQAQSRVAWTAQPTARGAPQRSSTPAADGRVGPPARPGAGPGRERSRVSPVRIVGLVVVVLVVAGRCLNGLT